MPSSELGALQVTLLNPHNNPKMYCYCVSPFYKEGNEAQMRPHKVDSLPPEPAFFYPMRHPHSSHTHLTPRAMGQRAAIASPADNGVCATNT